MCILSVYTLLKVVGYYDLSVLSMSVMGFQRKVWMGVSSIQFRLGFLDFFKLCKTTKKVICSPSCFPGVGAEMVTCLIAAGPAVFSSIAIYLCCWPFPSTFHLLTATIPWSTKVIL